MVNPVAGATEAYLAIFENLPISIRALVYLTLGFFLVSGIIGLLRGAK